MMLTIFQVKDELLTGQSTYKGIHPVDLPRWVKSVPKDKWLAEAFNMKLMQEKSEDHNVMVNVMRLSLQCVEDDPKARPTVRDALRVQEQIEVQMILLFMVAKIITGGDIYYYELPSTFKYSKCMSMLEKPTTVQIYIVYIYRRYVSG